MLQDARSHTLTPRQRDEILSAFNKAMFARDVDAVYKVVTPDFVWRLPVGPTAPGAREVRSREQLAAYLDERARLYEGLRYADGITYHAPDASFITFHLTGRKRATGAAVDVHGLDRFLFRDGKVMHKDAYWKRIETE